MYFVKSFAFLFGFMALGIFFQSDFVKSPSRGLASDSVEVSADHLAELKKKEEERLRQQQEMEAQAAENLRLEQEAAKDLAKTTKYREQCEEVKKYLVKDDFNVNCHLNYHHYNAPSSGGAGEFYDKAKAREGGKLKIAGFNVWHPGMGKTRYKDYELVAKVIDNWDLVAAVELLPIIGEDFQHNQAIMDLVNNGEQYKADLTEKITAVKDAMRGLSRRSTEYKKHSGVLKGLRAEERKLKRDIVSAPKHYRAPGYLHILEELLKLDESWSLILAPRGEAAKETDVHELAGFFYRRTKVRPTIQYYCKEYKTGGVGNPFACIPSFSSSFFGRDVKDSFSRRPFMANFESGNFDFTLLTSHVVFTSPKQEDKMESILQDAFGVSHYKQAGKGVSKSNYARLAELDLMMEFMDKLRKTYKEKDVILVGDFNIENKNRFWPELFKSFPGGDLVVDGPTSVTVGRYDSKGNPTYGDASNYDHFVLDGVHSRECKNFNDEYYAGKYSFYMEDIKNEVEKKYIIREKVKDEQGRYDFREGKREYARRHVASVISKMKNRWTVKNKKIVKVTVDEEKYTKSTWDRLFISQIRDQTYYQVYKEVLSDHFPIFMECHTDIPDDDDRR